MSGPQFYDHDQSTDETEVIPINRDRVPPAEQPVKRGGLLTTAMVFGITGGVFGILSALLAMVLGGVGAAFGASDSGMVVGLGFAAVFISVVGIVGGALAKSKPKAATVTLLIAAVGGAIAISAAWLIAGPLLLIGAAFAFAGRKAVG